MNHPPFARHGRTPAGALVWGGDYRGLGVVRSLGRRGIPVWVLTDRHAIAATSRYCRRSLYLPSGPIADIDFLLQLSAEYRLSDFALFPTSDETTVRVANNYDRLSSAYILTTPRWEHLSWAHDKRHAYAVATELGVPHPWTFCPKNLDEVAALECSFPILLKPARRDELNPLTFEKAWVVHDRRELLARYDDAAAMMGPDAVMLQEWIPGNGEHQYAFACLALGGVPLASLTVQRRRQWPIDFGRSSSYVVTVDEPEVESLSRRLLRATGFTGLVEIEFKFDSRDGSYRLLDVNPRIWGWHTLGYAVGIDFPYLLWTLLNGGTVPQLHSSAGVRWVRMLTDLPAAARELVNGATGPLEYLQTLRPPIATAIFAIDDPLPFLAEVPLMIWSRISHKLNTTRLAPAPGATHNPAVSRREKTQSGTGLAA